MGSILNETDRAAIASRVRSLSISSTGRWGSLDVTGMLKHLHLASLMAVGEMRGAFGKQTRVPYVSTQAPHSLCGSLPEGSADGAEVEAADASGINGRRACSRAGIDRANRDGTSRGRGTGSSAVRATHVARMGRGHV